MTNERLNDIPNLTKRRKPLFIVVFVLLKLVGAIFLAMTSKMPVVY